METPNPNYFLNKDKSYKLDYVCNFTSTRNANIHHTQLSDEVLQLSSIDEFFFFLIDDIIIDKIIQYTNIKLNKIGEKNTYPTEIKAYFGILLLFGCLKKNDVEVAQLWEQQDDSVHNVPYATAAMPRDRFKTISRNICFDNILLRTVHEHSKITLIFCLFFASFYYFYYF